MSDPRKASLPDRFEAVQSLAAKARGELAARTFDLETVMAAITAAAAEGFSSVTIDPPKPIDLRATQAWKDTATTLQGLGFTTEAKERPTKADGPSGWALVVLW